MSGMHAFVQSADAESFEPQINITTTVQNPTAPNIIPFTVQFDQNVSGFDVSDIVVSSGEVSNFSRIVPYIGQIGHGNSTGAPVDAGRDYYLLRDPESVAINGSDYVYVVDAGRHQVIVYAPDGTYAGNRPTSSNTPDAQKDDLAGRVGNQYTTFGSENHKFDNPRDIAISPTTRFIYVVDTDNDRVMVFYPNHTYADKITGVGSDPFDWPRGIAINATGFIYITDYERKSTHTVEVYYPNHTHAETIGGNTRGTDPRQPSFPTSVAINSTGHIFIGGGSDDVRVFNPDHTYAYTLDETPLGALWGVAYVHIDEEMDQIYVVERGAHRVSVFASDGTFLYAFGSDGDGDGQFRTPTGIATNSKGHIYVTDEGDRNEANRVSIFAPLSSYTFDVSNPASGQLVVSIPPGAVQHPDTQNGNTNTGVARIDVQPADTEPPVISGIYNNSVSTHTFRDSYSAPDVTCTDNADGNNLFVKRDPFPGPINQDSLPGTYYTTYTCTDAAGNTATMITTVHVTFVEIRLAATLPGTDIPLVDTEPPRFTPEVIQNVRVGLYETYVDEPPTCTDDVAGNLYVHSTGAMVVDTTMVNKYKITYTCTDPSGNKAEVSRFVIVQDATAPNDATPPVLTLKGKYTEDDPYQLRYGTTYVEPGFTCKDADDPDPVVMVSDTDGVGVDIFGIVYQCYDWNDRVHSLTRYINVTHVPPPVITTLGPQSITMPQQDNTQYFTPPEYGVQCMDRAFDRIFYPTTDSVTSIDLSSTGEHTITYDCTDFGDRTTSATQTIRVRSAVQNGDNTLPQIRLSSSVPSAITDRDTVTITARVSDASGIGNIVWYDGSEIIHTDTINNSTNQTITRTYTATFEPGAHFITAIVYDGSQQRNVGIYPGTITFDVVKFDESLLLPHVYITPGSPVSEGGSATARITVTPPSEMVIRYQITEKGSYLTGAGARPAAGIHTIETNADGNRTISVRTLNDLTDEPDGAIEFRLLDGGKACDKCGNYTISQPKSIAHTLVRDNDGQSNVKVNLTTTESDPTNSTRIPFVANFTAPVHGLTASDITTSSGTVANFSTVDPGLFASYIGRIGIGYGTTGNYSFNHPQGLLIDQNDRLYAVDAINYRIQIYDSDGRYVDTIPNTLANGTSVFGNPFGIVLNGTGYIHLADGINGTVIFAPDGTYVGNIPYTGDGFRSNIAINDTGHIFTTHVVPGRGGNDQVYVHSPDGTLLHSFDVRDTAEGIAVNSTGYIYVSTSRSEYTVDIYAPNYTKVGEIAGGLSVPTYVHIDENDRIYISSKSGGKVQVYDSDGKTHLYTIGSAGSKPGQLSSPAGVALNSKGHVYVMSLATNYISIYEIKESGKAHTFDVLNPAGGLLTVAVPQGAVHDISYSSNVNPGIASITVNSTGMISERPTGLRTTAVGDGRVTLSWSAPSNHGSHPITDYIIQYRPVGGQWDRPDNDVVSTSRSATVTGLQNGVDHTFRVAAKTLVGQSPWSDVVTVMPRGTTTPPPPPPPRAPDAPTGLDADAGDAQVSLRWSVPSNNGAAITSYTIEYRAGSTGQWTERTSSTNSYTVSSLENGRLYEFRVHATNTAGNSPWSAIETATPQNPTPPPPPPPRAPDAPTILQANAGDAQVSLRWSIPADNGASISSYTIEYRAGSTGQWTERTSSTNSYTVPSLENGRLYEFRVHATNTAGNSPWSGIATATPRSTAPPPPSDTTPPEFTSLDAVEFTEFVPNTHTIAVTDESPVTFVLESHNVTGTDGPLPTVSTAGQLEWTPSEAQGGNPNTIYRVTVNATDIHQNSAQQVIHITVSESNTLPTLAPIQAQQNHISGQPITITLEATDSDVPTNTLTYTHNHTSGTITATDSRTASFAWTPTTSDVGTHYVEFTVSDGVGGTNSQVVVFMISDATIPDNDPPEFTSTDTLTFAELVPSTHTVAVNDSSAVVFDLASHNVTGTPAPTVSATTGLLEWTPSEVHGGNPNTIYHVTINATDSHGNNASQDIHITVSESNTRPVLTSIQAQQNHISGQPITIALEATDSDVPANTLTYDHNHTSGTITKTDSRTASFAWTPGTSDVGTHYVEFTVSDGMMGGIDSQVVTFVISNTMNQGTTDMQSSAPDAPTNLMIVAVGGGYATLSWSVPSNDGGSPITDYIVQYSSDAGSSWHTFNGTVSSMSANVTGLVNGLSYQFRVSAVNSEGSSDHSNIPAPVRPADTGDGTGGNTNEPADTGDGTGGNTNEPADTGDGTGGNTNEPADTGDGTGGNTNEPADTGDGTGGNTNEPADTGDGTGGNTNEPADTGDGTGGNTNEPADTGDGTGGNTNEPPVPKICR